MDAPVRLHAMDNLRALAMLAGVVFHAALAYSVLAQPVFPTADRDSSMLVDLFAWFLHLFRMPLFFVVAGFFAAMLVQRRGLAGMVRNRLLRIALPLVVALPLVNWALSASTLHAAATATHPSPLLALIRTLLAAPDGLPPHPPGTSHLWFLYYLLVFYVLVWVARNLWPAGLGARVVALHPLLQLLVFPLLLVPALAAVPAPHPAPESLLPQFWAIGLFGPFFAFGYLLHSRPALLERQRAHAPWLLAGSVLAYAAFLSLVSGGGAAATPWLLAVLQALVSVWMTSVCLSLGSVLLARSNALLRYLADASYWTYLLHLPVLFVIQYRLMDWTLAWPAKLAIALVATVAVCVGSYQLLVRHTPLARILGGGAARHRHRHGQARDAETVVAANGRS